MLDNIRKQLSEKKLQFMVKGLRATGMTDKQIIDSTVASWENMGYTDGQIRKCKRSLKRILDGAD